MMTYRCLLASARVLPVRDNLALDSTDPNTSWG
jgi:hypothetical protein